MKKAFLSLLTLFLIGLTPLMAQTGEGKNYTVGELETLGKLELTKIYIGYVQKLNLLLPYVPFNQKGEAVSLSNMGIPNTKDNNEDIKRLDSSSGSHNEALNLTLTNILPYADKENIIEGILFLQKMVQHIEAGL